MTDTLMFLNSHFVFVDDHAEFSQKAVGQAETTQGGEQLPDGLLSSFPHTPTSRQQNDDRGLVEHPAEHHGEDNELRQGGGSVRATDRLRDDAHWSPTLRI